MSDIPAPSYNLRLPVRWEELKTPAGVKCLECGHPSMRCFKSEVDTMTWGRPVRKQSRRCPVCKAVRHVFFFLDEAQ